MKIFKKTTDSTAQTLQDAQAEIRRLQEENKTLREENKILRESRSDDFATIFARFKTEASKLSEYADRFVIYRYKLVICILNNLLIPLFQANNDKDIVETLIKIRDILPNDFAQIMQFRILKQDTPDSQKLQSTYLDKVPGGAIDQKFDEMAESFKLADETRLFAKKLYEYFGKNVVDMRQEFDSKVWLESMLNIGMIAADWADHVHAGRDQMYCYNFDRIMKDFTNDGSHDFRLNDYTKSTEMSNAAYEFIQKLVDEFGIDRRKLAFTIQNYRINGDFSPQSTINFTKENER